jgi:RNase H-fold protein (predicted Holliday junction resolvase)
LQSNRLLIGGQVRREQRKKKMDALAAAILLQSYLDSTSLQSSPGPGQPLYRK